MRMLRACLIAGTLATAAGPTLAEEADCGAATDELRVAILEIMNAFPGGWGGVSMDDIEAHARSVVPEHIPPACIPAAGGHLTLEANPSLSKKIEYGKNQLVYYFVIDVEVTYNLFGLNTGIYAHRYFVRIYYDHDGKRDRIRSSSK